MEADYYTNGIDLISIKQKQSLGYLVKDKSGHLFILSNLRGYRRVGDTRSIKDWYEESKAYIKKHPLAALMAGMGVFFGLINF